MRKLSLVFVATLLAALTVASASAQDNRFCGDLSAADCDLYYTALTEIPTSATFHIDATLSVAADEPAFDVSIAMDGSGEYIADRAVGEMMLNMQSGNFTSYVDDVTNMFGGIDSTMKLDLTVDVAAPAEVAAQADAFLPSPISLDLALVDGIGYIDLGAFAFLDPSLDGVFGVNLVEFYGMAFAMSGMTNETMAATMEDFDMSAASEYMTLSRDADVDVMGQQAAVFTFEVDYEALFASDVMRAIMAAQLENQMAMMDAPMDIDTLLDAYAVAFAGSTISASYTIGLDDNFVHATAGVMDFSMDMGAIIAAVDPAAAEVTPMPTIDMDMDFTVTQSGFDSVDAIAAPADAEIVPLGALMGGAIQ